MTIIIACKEPKTNRLHMMSDGLTTYAGNSLYTGNKWTEFDKYYIAIAGDVIVKDWLRCLATDEVKNMSINTRGDVMKLQKLIEEGLIADTGWKRTIHDSRDYIDMCMVIATKTGQIYSSEQFLSVVEHDDFACVGSGQYYAEGAMRLLWNTDNITSVNLKEVLKIVELYRSDCKGVEHNYLLIPEPNE